MTFRLLLVFLCTALIAEPVAADEFVESAQSIETPHFDEGAVPLNIPSKNEAESETAEAPEPMEQSAEGAEELQAVETQAVREELEQPAGETAQESVASSDVESRLSFIESALDERAEYAPWWKYGWMTFFGGASLLQLGGGLLDIVPPEGAYVGSATAFLGAADMVISPVDGGSSAKRAKACRNEPSEAAQLTCAERVLYETARGEEKGTNWTPYVLSALVSTSAALITVYAFDQPWLASKSKGVDFLGGGAFKIISGVVASQLRIHSTPRGGRKAWREYQSRYGISSAADDGPSFSLLLTPDVVGVNVSF